MLLPLFPYPTRWMVLVVAEEAVEEAVHHELVHRQEAQAIHTMLWAQQVHHLSVVDDLTVAVAVVVSDSSYAEEGEVAEEARVGDMTGAVQS